VYQYVWVSDICKRAFGIAVYMFFFLIFLQRKNKVLYHFLCVYIPTGNSNHCIRR
jgi:hypothetical protein